MKKDISTTLPGISASNLLDGIPLGVAIVDRDLRLVTMNRSLEAQTGYSLADAKGVYVDYVLRSSLGGRGQAFRKVIASGEADVVDGDIINRDRRKIPIHFTLSPLWNEDGALVGLVIVLDDLESSPSSVGLLKDYSESDGIIGQSEKMQEVFDLIPLMAHTDASVLITGETGTGKDIIAESIHRHSSRAKKPFIKVNCGALPENLLESELFGHLKGSFTGAIKDKPGMFKMADGGTLFLTEIGDMPLPLQVKLLSVLDDREFFAVGGDAKIRVDVRVIAATHRSLIDRVRTGEFREDLYYRLNVLHLHLPPLRERGTDIRYLLHHFLNLISQRNGKIIKAFTEEALAHLMSYPYPGNIRELRNIVEYGVSICQSKAISVEHLPKYIFTEPDFDPAGRPARAPEQPADQPETSLLPDEPQTQAADKDWMALERELIVKTMLQTKGNRSKAAAILGWGRTTLWRKLKLHGLSSSTD